MNIWWVIITSWIVTHIILSIIRKNKVIVIEVSPKTKYLFKSNKVQLMCKKLFFLNKIFSFKPITLIFLHKEVLFIRKVKSLKELNSTLQEVEVKEENFKYELNKELLENTNGLYKQLNHEVFYVNKYNERLSIY